MGDPFISMHVENPVEGDWNGTGGVETAVRVRRDVDSGRSVGPQKTQGFESSVILHGERFKRATDSKRGQADMDSDRFFRSERLGWKRLSAEP